MINSSFANTNNEPRQTVKNLSGFIICLPRSKSAPYEKIIFNFSANCARPSAPLFLFACLSPSRHGPLDLRLMEHIDLLGGEGQLGDHILFRGVAVEEINFSSSARHGSSPPTPRWSARTFPAGGAPYPSGQRCRSRPYAPRERGESRKCTRPLQSPDRQ